MEIRSAEDKQEFNILKTNINHKGLQRTANEYAEKRRIYKDLISNNNNVDILNSARIFFVRAFSGCCAILTSPKKGETAIYGYNPALF